MAMNGSKIELRPAAASDIEAVVAVIIAAYRIYDGRLRPPSSALEETGEAVARYLQRGGVIVAECEREIVGAVRYETRDAYVYLGRLAVAPAWQGRGIARRLVAAVEEWTEMIGLDEVQLGVRVELAGNRALYEHLGYTVAGLVPFRNDPRYSFLHMKKRLRNP